ncbi:MAG: thiol:disulfide interchange protein [Proteobacteria bacterium]|nr:thiol:disulfide interchange protein [Pseudomonadota bacterium]
MSLRLNFLKGGLCALAMMGMARVAQAEISEKDFSAAMEKYLATDKGQKAFLEFLSTAQQKQQELAQKKQMEAMQAKLDEQFKNPVKIDTTGNPVRGPANAKVTVVEFSDFQCPYCKRGKETVDEIMKAYPNDVKFVFKQLPLPFHPQARPAAKASVAAMKQGKFWEMHDALFSAQENLGEAFYLEQAKKLNLNVDKFKADMASAETDEYIKKDEEAAKKLGIGGTPSFAVNGVEVRGAYPVDYFKTIIDRHLKK